MVRYSIKVNFLIYGKLFGSTNNPTNQINEFIEAVRKYSQLDIIPTIVEDPTPLNKDTELSYTGQDGSCKFLSPDDIYNNKNRLSLVPTDTSCNIALWNYDNVNICAYGLTWGESFYGVPFISIPMYTSGWNETLIKSDNTIEWNYAGSGVIFHEFAHAISYIICNLSIFKTDCIPNADKCGDYGFTGYPLLTNGNSDWLPCLTWIYSKITPEMYIAARDQGYITEQQSKLSLSEFLIVGLTVGILYNSIRK